MLRMSHAAHVARCNVAPGGAGRGGPLNVGGRQQPDRPMTTTPALTRRTLIGTAAALALPSLVRPAAAQTVDIAAAKKEGRVVLYTSAPIAAAQKVANSFQQKYGITVELFRSGGTQVLRRFMMEHDANATAADLLVSSDPAAVLDLTAKGLFEPFQPAGFDKVPEQFRDPKGNYVAQRISVISFYGRTDLVAANDMPKTWDDLLNPRYKGKMVMTNPSFTSLQLGVIAMMSKARGWNYFEKLNANDVLVVQGNEQALNLVKTGERPIAAGADSQYANEARLAGHKIQNFFPSDGTFAIPATTSVVKRAKNPNAAKLLAEYTLSLEAEKLWPESGIYAARVDVDPPPQSPRIGDIKVIPMDYAYITGVTAQVKRKFSEIFSI
jgi:iron(III) transport system substrate-binding protein